MIAPGPGMAVDCSRCGGSHRFCDPCPPVGEYSRMLERRPIVPVFTEAEVRFVIPRTPLGDREWGGS